MSISKKTSEGFVLLPIVLMLIGTVLILFALSQEFTTHILLTKETHQYLDAQNILPEVSIKIEKQLSLVTPHTPDPKNQEDLLAKINTWPSDDIENNKIKIYSQLIHLNDTSATYSSLISVADRNAEQRLLYELISICTLADHQCNPLQSTLL